MTFDQIRFLMELEIYLIFPSLLVTGIMRFQEIIIQKINCIYQKMIRKNVIIGKINDSEPTIRFNLNLNCTKCGKKVPGGMLTSEKYFGSHSFLLEVENFKKNYFCGICRDKKRVHDKIHK